MPIDIIDRSEAREQRERERQEWAAGRARAEAQRREEERLRQEQIALRMFDLDVQIIVTIVKGDESGLDTLLKTQRVAAANKTKGINNLFAARHHQSREIVIAALKLTFGIDYADKLNISVYNLNNLPPLTIAVQMLGLDNKSSQRRNILARILEEKPAFNVRGQSHNVFLEAVRAGDAQTFKDLQRNFIEQFSKENNSDPRNISDLIGEAASSGKLMFDCINALATEIKYESKNSYNEHFSIPLKMTDASLQAVLMFFRKLVLYPSHVTYPMIHHVTCIIGALVRQAANPNLVIIINQLLDNGALFEKNSPLALASAFNYVIKSAPKETSNPQALLKVFVAKGIRSVFVTPDSSGSFAIHHAAEIENESLVYELLQHAPFTQATAKNKQGKTAADLTKNNKIRAALHHALLLAVNVHEDKGEIFTGFDFLKNSQEQKTSDKKDDEKSDNEKNRTKFVEEAFNAIGKSDVEALCVYLGPDLHTLHQTYHNESYGRYKAWLKVKPEIDFYVKTIRLIKSHTRKLFEAEFLKESVKESVQETLNKDQTVQSAVEQKVVRQNDEKETVQASQQASVASPQPVNVFLQSHNVGVLTNLKLNETQKQSLKDLIRQEFESPDLRLGGLSLVFAPRMETNRPKALDAKNKGFAPHSTETEPKTLQRLARAISASSPIITSVVSDSKENNNVVLSQIGKPEWHNLHQRMLTQQQSPKQSQLTAWLQSVYVIIDTQNNLQNVLQALGETFHAKQAQCQEYEEAQQKENNLYDQKCFLMKIKFKEKTVAFFCKNGKNAIDAEVIAEQIIQNQIGELPLDSKRFLSPACMPLLHDAIKKYKNEFKDEDAANTTNSKNLETIEELLKRGSSPNALFTYPTNNMVTVSVSAFQYAWDGKEEKGIPDWDVLRLTFKYMPVFNQLTATICAYVAGTYCSKSKKEEAGYFYGVFHSREIKKERRAELVALGKLIYQTGNYFDDSLLIAWIKQKNKIAVAGSSIKTEAAKRGLGGYGGSDLHKKLLSFVNDAEVGKLDCFCPQRDQEMRPMITAPVLTN